MLEKGRPYFRGAPGRVALCSRASREPKGSWYNKKAAAPESGGWGRETSQVPSRSVGDAREGAVLQRVLEEEASLSVRGAPEGQGEHVSEILGEMELEGVADLLRQILEIGLVVFGQQDRGDPGPLRDPA